MKAARNLMMIAATAGLLATMSTHADAGSVNNSVNKSVNKSAKARVSESTTEVTADSVVAPTAKAVKLSDLNLNSVEGQRTLYYRLARAAEQACGPGDVRRAGSVSVAARNDECAEDALSRALSKVTAAALVSVSLPAS